MKVAFATPELLTLVRRTNLAEISEFLPAKLHSQGVDLRVFLPHHRDINTDVLSDYLLVGKVEVPEATELVEVSIYTARLGNLPIVLTSHPTLFDNRHPYGDENGPYADNWRRYAVYSRAVLEAMELLSFSPDVIHCMDWTSGLIPLIQRLEYCEARPGHCASKAGTFFAVHNLAMQGSFEREILPRIGIPHSYFRYVEGIELGAKVNFLKAGAEFATIVGTHSPSQALRLTTEKRGDGLDETFRRRDKELVGVLSGIDYQAWDPNTDQLLAQTYSKDSRDPCASKRKCKGSLQDGLSLEVSPRTPLITIIGRFDSDSGFDILSQSMTAMLERNLQLVLMGPGQPEVLERARTVEQTFSGSCRVLEGYNVNSAHTLLGGADILLLPSHYNSSNALCAIAMRYGVLPLAYTRSGLEDAVVDIGKDPENGTGFMFEHYTGESLLEGMDATRAMFKKAKTWKQAVMRCLEQDFSWTESARNYLLAYRRVTRRARAKT